MDTVTHTLFGAGIYQATKKEEMTKREKYALLFTSIVGSQIPDIDIVSQLWDQEGMYQMWHRGITHSILLAPIWALVIYWLVRVLFKVNHRHYFFIAMIAVAIHNSSDVLNAWGTGYFEPISDVRLTLGTIPIIDFVIWTIFLVSFLLKRFSRIRATTIFRYAWLAIVLHIALQTAQGMAILHDVKTQYEEVTLSADFIPWQYTVVGKNGNEVDLALGTLWSGIEVHTTLYSDEEADLEALFASKPEAETLTKWSPFVVVVNDDNQLGVFDPRFYINGESFLYIYIDK
ncbi:inner membrane protein [Bacillus mesophilus]|uniref:Metal-dependent hydrolase n=1 Tax=Bacillus mesophilus TaxID=1808955 RepID=A0A6M0QDP5_9BACI|nr:metal-dependent hydrolase [Bacillus mesophilus]MBM7662690.1 inner membrane protein [Bacillus mesophilus]NEY73248.1 metal-dependent hydrolase [Bacillus mesophilus]